MPEPELRSVDELTLPLLRRFGKPAAGSPSGNRGYRYRGRDAHHGDRETVGPLGYPAYCPHGQSP